MHFTIGDDRELQHAGWWKLQKKQYGSFFEVAANDSH